MNPKDLEVSLTNFTPRAQCILALACKEADRFNHCFVGTEHLLLGLLRLGQGTAFNVLTNMGINPDSLRAEVERQVGTGPDRKMIGQIPFTPRVQKVLALAAKEAMALNHEYVGTEHILLGLVRDGDGVAARVLKNLSVDPNRVRTEILLVLEIANRRADQNRPFGAKDAPAKTPSFAALGNRTPRAQQVLALAREEVQQRNLQFVGTEHLLLGLARLPHGITVNTLAKFGVNQKIVEAQVEEMTGHRPSEKHPFEITDSPLAIETLLLAAEDAQQLSHTYIGTEHLLLGLLRQTDGGAAQIFRNLGINTALMQREIFNELDSWGIARPSASAGTAASRMAQKQVDRSDLPRDLFTPRVRRAFSLALEEAELRKEPFIETEHVLLGLVRMGQGVAAGVLIKIGVNAETVATRFGNPAKSESPDKTAEPPRFGPLVKEVLAVAAEEARALEHTYIGTEHILLGLLRQPHGGAARIFKELCVDTEALRKQIMIAFEVKTFPAKGGAPGDPAVEQFGSKHTETFRKKPTAETVFTTPDLAKSTPEPLNLSLRYDVYCVERDGKTVVHRNVQFKSVKKLFAQSDDDSSPDFVELEQPDKTTIFIAKSAIVRFCPTGVKPDIENL